MIEITKEVLSPEKVVNATKTEGSGCIVTYVGQIRDNSEGKKVLSVEYLDTHNDAVETLKQIAGEVREKWAIENISICHRIGKLKVGDFNLVVAIAAGHRGEGFAACQYVIDQFKKRLPTAKTETYRDGSVLSKDARLI
jgi:molybdopterin synthase catalytic subunit